jgi:hypothetical protein
MTGSNLLTTEEAARLSEACTEAMHPVHQHCVHLAWVDLKWVKQWKDIEPVNMVDPSRPLQSIVFLRGRFVPERAEVEESTCIASEGHKGDWFVVVPLPSTESISFER